MTDPDPDIPPREVLAAELALGLLDGEERARALRLRLSDRDFADLTRRWEAEIGDWIEELPDETVSPGHWQRVALTLGAVPAAGDAPEVPSAAGWKFGTVAAGVAAVVFAGLWLAEPRADRAANPTVIAQAPAVPAPTPTVTATAQPAGLAVGDLSVGQVELDADQTPVWAAYDRRTGVLLVRLGTVGGPDQVPALWLIADAVPKPIAFLSGGKAVSTTLDATTRAALENGGTLAISLEAPAASLPAAPQGPVLGQVPLSQI